MKFCRSCGTPLPLAPSAPTPIPPAPMPMPMPTPMPGAIVSTVASGTPAPVVAARGPSSTITCPRCGTSTPIGFAYCQQCGLHIQPIAPTDPGQVGVQVRMRTPSSAPAGVDAHGATMAQPDSGLRPSAKELAKSATVPQPSTAVAWGSAVLVNRDGSDGQRFALTSDDTVLGRAGADIAFDDDRFLARQHARLERTTDGSVRIHALDAFNGVFKKADAPVELVDGSVVLVGREVLRFEKVTPDERTVHPLVRHGVSLFGSPPREPWGRIMQVVPSGGYRDVRHLVTDEVVLGREEGDIVFRDDAFMSRRHAAITWDGRRSAASVTDLGSSNGTFVRIAGPTTLKHGDHIRLGDQLLRVELAR
jgi:FHA domain/Double zinc ribbon